ncbi:MAG: hypothetical protein JO252_16465 [Planctomycetaceae bacterium]|nr:hypothetical protein [Planctomycetaceae bacterium]
MDWTARRCSTSYRLPMQDDPNDDRLFTHLLTILSVSAAMVGACLTAIGIIGVFKVLKRFETICDDLMAADSFLFLATAVLCFVGLRTPLRKWCRAVVLAVDVLFCFALVLMAAVCGVFVWLVI